MKKFLTLVFTLLLIFSITACSKQEDIKIQDTDLGKIEYENVDVMGVTYDLFDMGYASITDILHKDAQISETVTYEGKDYNVIAVGFEWDDYDNEWEQRSVFFKNLYSENNAPENLVIPHSVIYIGTQAFSGCTSKTITLSPKIDMLLGRVFENCVNLETIEFPDSITYLGVGGMFGNCQSLKTINLPDWCQYYEDVFSGWFIDCYSLESAVIPGVISKIGNMTFWNCNSLADVTLCEGIETIGTWTFGHCPKLTRLVIPDSVSVIEEQAFLQFMME